nr:alpha/beta fold hydrolase [Amylibacter sp.]
MDWVMVVLRFALVSVAIYLLIAGALILSQWPSKAGGDGLDFAKLDVTGDPVEPVTFLARDGTKLAVRTHGGQGGPLAVVVHGSGGHGAAYDWLGARIAAQTGAQVLVPDLRGHGVNPAPKGDVAYIGQLEDDLADLIAQYRTEGQKLLLLGHSSGGGLVVRFAGGDYGDTVDAAVLLAPFLKYNAPTMRPDAGGWARPLTRRLIGLSMLNMLGLKMLNGMTAIVFNLPEGALAEHMAGAYSYRMNTSFSPRSDYLKDLAALPPFVVIAGKDDEAFLADQYQPVMAAVNDKGRYHILDGVSHLDVFTQEKTVDLVTEFMRDRL